MRMRGAKTRKQKAGRNCISDRVRHQGNLPILPCQKLSTNTAKGMLAMIRTTRVMKKGARWRSPGCSLPTRGSPFEVLMVL